MGLAHRFAAQSGDTAFLDRVDKAMAVYARSTFVTCNIQQRRRQVRLRRHLFQQPTGVGRRGDEIARGHALRCVPLAVRNGASFVPRSFSR